MPEDQPLFYTQKGRRMERSRAYKILNKAARAVGITRRIGTHTLRKTFGYHCYQKYDDVVLLQKIFNHSSPQITLRYIGIEQEDIDAVYREFYLQIFKKHIIQIQKLFLQFIWTFSNKVMVEVMEIFQTVFRFEGLPRV